MTIFDVYVNDRKLCRAGVGADGVLTAIVRWVKLTGIPATKARRLREPVEETALDVGGLSKDVHQRWLEGRGLKAGDRVTIVIGTANASDPPADRHGREPPSGTRSERPGAHATDAGHTDNRPQVASPPVTEANLAGGSAV